MGKIRKCDFVGRNVSHGSGLGVGRGSEVSKDRAIQFVLLCLLLGDQDVTSQRFLLPSLCSLINQLESSETVSLIK